MSLEVDWSNPYRNQQGEWRKGNLHAHTAPASGCAHISAPDCLKTYARAGFDFLAISDHMTLTEVAAPGIAIVPGIEWNSAVGEHTGVYAAAWDDLRAVPAMDRQDALLAHLADKPVLVVLNHPNWGMVAHYAYEDLARCKHFDAIEAFNGVIGRLSGSALAFEKWDQLLSAGRRVLGIGSDDSHFDTDIGKAWLHVRAAGCTPADILAGLRSGNFYGSTGITLTRIVRKGGKFEIESPDATEIRAIGEGGRVLGELRRPGAAFTFDASRVRSAYVRFAALDERGGMAWTQPFFRK